jgi:hypothetical protein
MSEWTSVFVCVYEEKKRIILFIYFVVWMNMFPWVRFPLIIAPVANIPFITNTFVASSAKNISYFIRYIYSILLSDESDIFDYFWYCLVFRSKTKSNLWTVEVFSKKERNIDYNNWDNRKNERWGSIHDYLWFEHSKEEFEISFLLSLFFVFRYIEIGFCDWGHSLYISLRNGTVISSLPFRTFEFDPN